LPKGKDNLFNLDIEMNEPLKGNLVGRMVREEGPFKAKLG
jgi:hypothetical protein